MKKKNFRIVLYLGPQEQELKEFWGKEKHIDKIIESYEGMCMNCASAKFA